MNSKGIYSDQDFDDTQYHESALRTYTIHSLLTRMDGTLGPRRNKKAIEY